MDMQNAIDFKAATVTLVNHLTQLGGGGDLDFDGNINWELFTLQLLRSVEHEVWLLTKDLAFTREVKHQYLTKLLRGELQTATIGALLQGEWKAEDGQGPAVAAVMWGVHAIAHCAVAQWVAATDLLASLATVTEDRSVAATAQHMTQLVAFALHYSK
jgi:hypothetical protein